jgi:hypothetical protein
MSEKIVFNGREYDGVEAMPPDVRRQYDDVLRLLADSGQTPGGPTAPDGRKRVNVKMTVRRRLVVNGKEYDGVEQLPPQLRAAYERATGGAGGGGGAGDSSGPAAAPPRQVMPPPLPDDDAGGRVRRVALLLVAGLLVALWVALRR